MRTVFWILRLLCTTIFLIIGIYSFLALIIAAFILAGTLTTGEVMIYDSVTPTLPQCLLFASSGGVAAAVVGYIRHKLSQKILIDHSPQIGGA